jgi:hypothetical protein
MYFKCVYLRSGKVDAREVVAVILLCCSSTLNEKLGALFNFFDTDSDQLMNSSELAIMLSCAIRGMDKICLQGSTSDASVHLKIATSIVKQFDPSGKRKINFANLFSWIIKSPSAISLCCRRGTSDSAGFVLKFFSGDDVGTSRIYRQCFYYHVFYRIDGLSQKHFTLIGPKSLPVFCNRLLLCVMAQCKNHRRRPAWPQQ